MVVPKVSRHTKSLLVAITVLFTVLLCHRQSRIISTHFADFRTTPDDPDVNLKNYQIRDNSLRSQIAIQFPYDQQPIPKTIWQTWKTGFQDTMFPSSFRSHVETWRNYAKKHANPQLDFVPESEPFAEDTHSGFIHTLISDKYMARFMDGAFSALPQIQQVFSSMPKPILKADFFRYLILLARGGVYSDVDTRLIKGVEEWPTYNPKLFSNSEPLGYGNKGSAQTEETKIGMVIGIEADPDRPDWQEWYARRIQFCQWTIQARRGHPVLRELVLNITTATHGYHDNIMDWTGPGIFTDTIFEYMNKLLEQNKGITIYNDNLKDSKYKEKALADLKKNKISWEFFTGMESPILVDDILVLPITAFSPGVGHMGSKTSSDPDALVLHIFEGSWKPEDEKM